MDLHPVGQQAAHQVRSDEPGCTGDACRAWEGQLVSSFGSASERTEVGPGCVEAPGSLKSHLALKSRYPYHGGFPASHKALSSEPVLVGVHRPPETPVPVRVQLAGRSERRQDLEVVSL